MCSRASPGHTAGLPAALLFVTGGLVPTADADPAGEVVRTILDRGLPVDARYPRSRSSVTWPSG